MAFSQTWLDQPDTVADLAGPGRWFVAQYTPVGLFSLKHSFATSSVGKSFVLPTPYSIKMALVDAAYRVNLTEEQVSNLLASLRDISVRISPPEIATVTHTFVKIRQERRKDKAKKNEESEPADGLELEEGEGTHSKYQSSIAYREVVHHKGLWHWAFDLATGTEELANQLLILLPHISYIGKRGSFIQYCGVERRNELGADFTQVISNQDGLMFPTNAHILPLDDFGPEASLEVLSSFSELPAKREKHRVFRQTIIPLGLVNSGPGFSEYRRD